MSEATTELGRAQRARAIAGLYAVTPDTEDTDWLIRAVSAAVLGGARIVQYRNKTANPALRRVQARALAAAVARGGAMFLVNDDPQLAAEVEADGVHVGEDDTALAAARAIMGPRGVIGVSCYNELSRARDAVTGGADYVAFGSFFPSVVKPAARRADPTLLEQGRTLGVPLVAIGGITAANAAQLRMAGADAVAVISAVFDAGEPASIELAARAIASLFAPFGSAAGA